MVCGLGEAGAVRVVVVGELVYDELLRSDVGLKVVEDMGSEVVVLELSVGGPAVEDLLPTVDVGNDADVSKDVFSSGVVLICAPDCGNTAAMIPMQHSRRRLEVFMLVWYCCSCCVDPRGLRFLKTDCV